jgi:hypothetical protein
VPVAPVAAVADVPVGQAAAAADVPVAQPAAAGVAAGQAAVDQPAPPLAAVGAAAAGNLAAVPLPGALMPFAMTAAAYVVAEKVAGQQCAQPALIEAAMKSLRECMDSGNSVWEGSEGLGELAAADTGGSAQRRNQQLAVRQALLGSNELQLSEARGACGRYCLTAQWQYQLVSVPAGRRIVVSLMLCVLLRTAVGDVQQYTSSCTAYLTGQTHVSCPCFMLVCTTATCICWTPSCYLRVQSCVMLLNDRAGGEVPDGGCRHAGMCAVSRRAGGGQHQRRASASQGCCSRGEGVETEAWYTRQRVVCCSSSRVSTCGRARAGARLGVCACGFPSGWQCICSATRVWATTPFAELFGVDPESVFEWAAGAVSVCVPSSEIAASYRHRCQEGQTHCLGKCCDVPPWFAGSSLFSVRNPISDRSWREFLFLLKPAVGEGGPGGGCCGAAGCCEGVLWQLAVQLQGTAPGTVRALKYLQAGQLR